MGNYLKNGGRMKGCKLSIQFENDTHTFKSGSLIIGVVNISTVEDVIAYGLQATLELKEKY